MEISVIIPVYNTEAYLEECLDSVIAQQFEDWECLLIDDGSNDRSSSICDLYASRDGRFKVFHIVNSGVSAARNLGIEHASGTYIAFIDSDDTVAKSYLSRLYEAMMQVDAELIVGGMKLVRPLATEINTATQGLVIIGSEDSNRFVELNRKFLLYGPVVKLYHSYIIKSNNIRFPSGVQYGEDLIFNLEYLKYVTNIFVINTADYNYRILSEGSLSSSAHSRNFANNYTQWKIICSFFKRKKINSSNAQIYLSNRLWGIAYDLVMSNKLSVKEIKNAFSIEFLNDLRAFNKYTIPIPSWLRMGMSGKFYRLMWLIQRRAK
ncbi:glycosyltransferase family 2 protein [Dysgonomonas sp. ZJ279]|uniref:glycosyltransferase family 2 protein n=1 Tax=Dysgonomonas sp. ZJ279 TaxID=2709796 RepID=UPI0013ED2B50|nr:glycosyltransferase family 2 protein [Dysgonomonas sp. ZJ279]